MRKFLRDEKKLSPPDIFSVHTFLLPKYHFRITFPPDDIFPTSFFSILCMTFFIFFFKQICFIATDSKVPLQG